MTRKHFVIYCVEKDLELPDDDLQPVAGDNPDALYHAAYRFMEQHCTRVTKFLMYSSVKQYKKTPKTLTELYMEYPSFLSNRQWGQLFTLERLNSRLFSKALRSKDDYVTYDCEQQEKNNEELLQCVYSYLHPAQYNRLDECVSLIDKEVKEGIIKSEELLESPL